MSVQMSERTKGKYYQCSLILLNLFPKSFRSIRCTLRGSKAEINKASHDTDPRLVFELEYLESLPDYKPIKLNIFNSFRDTVLGEMIDVE